MRIWKLKQLLKRFIGDKTLAPHNLVILCNPRSGSTWLMDLLRSHPKVEMQKSAGFYNVFGLDGRRYPVDLSNQVDGSKELEVLPSEHVKIPALAIPSVSMHETLFPSYKLEKIHPEFFEFATADFIKNVLAKQKEGHEFKFILLVRNPISAIDSFYRYQQRNPKWYSWLKTEKLVEFTLKTFQSMANFQQEFGGLAIDYTTYITEPDKVLEKIYNYLWFAPNYLDGEQISKDITASLSLTARTKRQQTTGTSFLGQEVGKVELPMEELSFYQKHYQDDLEQCLVYYRQVLESE